jgi:hypothetical protein
MSTRVVSFVAIVLAAAPLRAQQPVPPTLPTAMPGMQDPQAMMAAYAAAQAAANRPGDEKLGCDELQAQFTAAMNDPKIKAHVEAAGAAAQHNMAAMEAAQGQVAAGTAASAAAHLAPGGQWAALGAAVSQAELAKANAAGNMAQHMALAKGATELMPLIMRGQRLIELGAARQCEWASGVGVPGAGLGAESMVPSQR